VLKVSKIILVVDMAKVELLKDAGLAPIGTREIEGKQFYQFAVTDKLLEVLNDKLQFSKNDFIYDMKLTF